MKLKACGIREKLENYKNIDFLGFNFIDYSKRKIDKFQAKKISEDVDKKKSLSPESSLPDGEKGATKKNIKKIGLFDEKFSFLEIVEIMNFAKLDGIQLHSDNLENFKKLKLEGFFIIKPIPLSCTQGHDPQGAEILSPQKGEKEVTLIENFVDLFIIDGEKSGSGKSYDYSKINDFKINKNFLVAGGVSEKNVLKIKKIFKNNKYFLGVDVASGVDNGENIDLEKVQKIYNLIK